MTGSQRGVGALALLVLAGATGLLVVQSCSQGQDARTPESTARPEPEYQPYDQAEPFPGTTRPQPRPEPQVEPRPFPGTEPLRPEPQVEPQPWPGTQPQVDPQPRPEPFPGVDPQPRPT